MEPEDALAELVTFGRFVEYSRWSRRWARRRISWYALELDEPDELDP